MTPEERERYARHILLREVGGQGQQKLNAARVLIVGAGGLGNPILSYLAAAGVGTIGVSDEDKVALSNLQRQTLFRTEDVGRAKTEAAIDAIARLNPHVKAVAHPRISESNAREIVAGYDLVVEGVDNFTTRYALNKACIAEKKPLVSAAIGRFEGQLSTFKSFAGANLPCYRCLVPEEPPRENQVNCAEEGVLGAVAGVMGTLAAMEAIKELLQLGESLAGRLLLYDALGGTFRTVRLPADPACPDCGGR
ncbi:MAG: molybdopterin-synthase adenylyltransferase MoeB [Parvularculaceae bacterium]